MRFTFRRNWTFFSRVLNAIRPEEQQHVEFRRGDVLNRTSLGTNLFDAVDWLGGLPCEAASSIEVETFLRRRGFEVGRRQLTTRSGCNEFVFRKLADQRARG